MEMYSLVELLQYRQPPRCDRYSALDRMKRGNKMNECPKCKSKNGFIYKLPLITNRIGDWGIDDDEETTCERTTEPKTVQCIDCGKRVEWNLAHGLDDEEVSKTLTG